MGKSCGRSPLSEDEAKEILSEKGINKTKSKIHILREFSKSHRPLSVQDIYEGLKQNCDVSTVFRAIAQFKEKNLIREVNLDEGFFRYEILVLEENHHHHHIRCRKCGEIKNIDKCDLAEFERTISAMGYREMEHRLEFSGLCPNCAKKSKVETGRQK
jgi:Fur family ferric uptake transcriptional regulator